MKNELQGIIFLLILVAEALTTLISLLKEKIENQSTRNLAACFFVMRIKENVYKSLASNMGRSPSIAYNQTIQINLEEKLHA